MLFACCPHAFYMLPKISQCSLCAGGLWAGKMQSGFGSREGALRRTALTSRLKTTEERVAIRNTIEQLHSQISSTNGM